MASLIQFLALCATLVAYSTILLDNARAEQQPTMGLADIMRQQRLESDSARQQKAASPPAQPSSWANIAKTPGSPQKKPNFPDWPRQENPRMRTERIAKSTPTLYQPGGQYTPPEKVATLQDCSNQNYNFDYMQLNVNWTPGYCRTSERKCFQNQIDGFNIHGMWPARYNEDPIYCCFQKSLGSSQIEPQIWRSLTNVWRSVHHEDRNYGTWQHILRQWQKHGTCARDMDLLRGPNAYFKNTIKIFNDLKIVETLEQAGIKPDSTRFYKGQAIANALRKSTGGNQVTLKCGRDKKNGKNTLMEITFCFGADKKFIDCQRSHTQCLGDIMFS